MKFVLTFVFLFLLFTFLYGYFSYYNVKKHLPKCDVIYILDDGIDDNSDPDFHIAHSNELANVDHKKAARIARESRRQMDD